MRCQRGYALIEILLAGLLFAVAGAGISSGFVQGVKADRAARKSFAFYDPLRFFWLRSSSDLRNAIPIHGESFIGSQDQMIWVRFKEGSGRTNLSLQISRIRYFMKGAEVVREEQVLSAGSGSKEVTQKVLLKKVSSLRFEYAYLDDDGKIFFQPVWSKQPYRGIPRAVKVSVVFGGAEEAYSRIIVLPQGVWGISDAKSEKTHEE